MNWPLAILAPALVTVATAAAGANAAQGLYHLLCAGAIAWKWKAVRPLLAWKNEDLPLSLVLSVLIAAGVCLPAFIWDPRGLRGPALGALLPAGMPVWRFSAFAVFVFLVHVPLEELYWRGAALEDGKPGALAGTAFFFYWLHAGPLYFLFGPRALAVALPTAAAGALWAQATLRSKSLWPAVISHWAAEVAILAGVWRCFLRP